MIRFILVLIAITALFSCNKKQDEIPDSILYSNVVMNFNHVVDEQPLVLRDVDYFNSLNQKYSVSKWNYIISNIKFYNNGELVFEEKNSYHYIRHEITESMEIIIKGVPIGTYDEIRYSFGVDEENNDSDITIGNVPQSMFWDDWKGFRFSSYAFSIDNSGLVIDIGGDSNYIEFVFSDDINLITKGLKNSTVITEVDINQLFESPNVIDFDSVRSVHLEEEAEMFVENVEDGMFVIKKIENPE